MSEAIGLVTVLGADRHAPVPGASSDSSEATQQLIDQEIRRLTETAHLKARDLLTVHRDQLDRLAEALLKSETLDELDAYIVAGVASRGSEQMPVTTSTGAPPPRHSPNGRRDTLLGASSLPPHPEPGPRRP